MLKFFKQVIARLPTTLQQEIKKIYCWYQIRSDRFKTWEPEYALLEKYVSDGDFVIDIGANVGHYTLKLSNLVGLEGRVIAIEPVPETFTILSSNTSHFRYRNVTLINMAASDHSAYVGIEIPKFESGLLNYYQAHISSSDEAYLKVLCFTIDSLKLPKRIRLIKIDAEGSELSVVNGLTHILERDKPILIIENNDPDLSMLLKKFGYLSTSLENSPNKLYQ